MIFCFGFNSYKYSSSIVRQKMPAILHVKYLSMERGPEYRKFSRSKEPVRTDPAHRSGTEQQIIRYTGQEPSKSLKSLNDRQSTDDYRRTRECRLRQHS